MNVEYVMKNVRHVQVLIKIVVLHAKMNTLYRILHVLDNKKIVK